MVAGAGGQPLLHLGMLMGAVVVDDEMDIEIGWHIGIDMLQELEKLLVAMPGFALC